VKEPPCAIKFMDNYSINGVADYLSGPETLRGDASVLAFTEIDGNNKGVTDEEAEHIITRKLPFP